MTKPNIIYIMADDMGYGDLSCLNDRSGIDTPQMDRLAAQGMIFSIGIIEAIVAVALSYVLAIVAARVSGETAITPIGALGKPVHLHLHDGHPLWTHSPFGISDHLSFLDELPIGGLVPRLPFAGIVAADQDIRSGFQRSA